jgi:transposase
MQRRRYSREYKNEAVRLLIIDGVSGKEVSEKLGLNINMVHRWKREHLRELGAKEEGRCEASPQEMAKELEQLRKELSKSQRINEILKKTVVYFAKED